MGDDPVLRHKSDDHKDSGASTAFDQQRQTVLNQNNTAVIHSKRPAILQIVIFLLLGSAILPALYYGKTHYDRASRASDSTTKLTIKSLDDIRAKNGEVVDAFNRCTTTLSGGNYLYFKELVKCRDSVAEQIRELQKLRDQKSTMIARTSLVLVDTVLSQEIEDLRTISVVAFLESSLEDSIVSTFWANMCFANYPKNNKKISEAMRSESDRQFRDMPVQMSQQNRLFFLLRDFTTPRLYDLQGMLEGEARQLGQLDDGSTLRSFNRAYANTLQEQSMYKEKDEPFPFTIGIVRNMESRDITQSYDAASRGMAQDNENARFTMAKRELPLMALRGRPEQVHKLVQCGVFKPEIEKNIESLDGGEGPTNH